MSKLVYLFDGLSVHNDLTTNFNGIYDCQESPLEAGVYLIPTDSTSIQPPSFDSEVSTCHWEGTQWILTDIPKPLPPMQVQANALGANQPITTGTITI